MKSEQAILLNIWPLRGHNCAKKKKRAENQDTMHKALLQTILWSFTKISPTVLEMKPGQDYRTDGWKDGQTEGQCDYYMPPFRGIIKENKQIY
jgi:hypothetical protein